MKCQDNEQAYLCMVKLLLSALNVAPETTTKIAASVAEDPAMIAKKNQALSATEITLLGEMKSEIETFLDRQKPNLAATKIQAVVRSYLARKKYNHLQGVYVKGRNEPIHELIMREMDYNRFLSQLTQKFAVPLLNTPDKALREESQDIGEFLKAIIDIERLHRGLLRKIKWFIEEGCEWPNVDGFGNIFLDLIEEFRAYGDYIRHFNYVLSLLDAIEEQKSTRLKLAQFLDKRGDDNVGFKALVTKPLNQIASYEKCLQKMADSTSSTDEDFKVIMGALSIISETNKHINASLSLSHSTAITKQIESNLNIKPSKVQPDLVKIYTSLRPAAQFDSEMPTEIHLKSALKKRLPGNLYFFSNLVLVTVQERFNKSLWKTHQIYTIPFIRVEQLPNNNIIQIFGLQNNSNSLQHNSNSPSLSSDQPRDAPNHVTRMRFESEKLCRDFVMKIDRLKEASQANCIFGVDLNVLVHKEKNPLQGVPYVVQVLCEYILEHFVETEGVFRVPGSAQMEKTLRAAFNENGGNGVDLSSYNVAAADVAGLIKLFFRELPSPLCGELFSKFVETQKKFNASQTTEMVAELKSLVKKLPQNNRSTLKYMCEFMHAVAEHAEVNKMNSSNVAMCIGPDLMKPPVDSIELALMVPKANEALAKMVQYCNEVF